MADLTPSRPLIEGTVFSHGTMECADPIKTQRFLQEFLGLHSVRKGENTQYVWCGGKWFIVCLNMSERFTPRQREDYRFALEVATSAEVEAARAAAIEQQAQWDILEVGDLVRVDGQVSFTLRDLNGAWWEIHYLKAAIDG